MALMKIKSSNLTVGVSNVTCAGITHVTSASAEKSFGTVSKAKDSNGDVVAALVGKESYSMSVSGYSTAANGPNLGDNISVGGLTGKVTSVNIEKTVEDFSRFSADGRGLP
jgi:hypothetical protein